MYYYLEAFLVYFFALIGVAMLLVLPLVICLILELVKDEFQIVGALSVFISVCTSIAVILFAAALLGLSIFGWIPWYASAILITAFFIAVGAAMRPWKKTQRGASLYIILGILIFLLALSWVGSWLSHDVCFTSAPTTLIFAIDRFTSTDPCVTSYPKPCHNYLTFGTNASTEVYVNLHYSQNLPNPVVYAGTAPAGTTYFYIVGNSSNPADKSFTLPKKFRTAPASGAYTFVSGGDMGVTTQTSELLEAAAELEPLYMALGGDLAYANSIYACWPRWDAWLSMYESNATTPSGYSVPIIAAPGNHEAGGWGQTYSQMHFYSNYFKFEETSSSTVSMHHVHYVANSVILALDAGVVELPTTQVSWMNSMLSSAPAGSAKFAIYHAPAYPSVRPFTDPQCTAVRDTFVPVFDNYNLTVAFENHDHAYKRTFRLRNGEQDPTGVLYVGDGAMGVPARPGVSSNGRPWIEASSSSQFFFYVELNTTAVKLTAISPSKLAFDGTTVDYN